MPEQSLHFVNGSACVDQKTRVAVPQIVNADALQTRFAPR
jgi:hypothetical protein